MASSKVKNFLTLITGQFGLQTEITSSPLLKYPPRQRSSMVYLESSRSMCYILLHSYSARWSSNVRPREKSIKF